MQEYVVLSCVCVNSYLSYALRLSYGCTVEILACVYRSRSTPLPLRTTLSRIKIEKTPYCQTSFKVPPLSPRPYAHTPNRKDRIFGKYNLLDYKGNIVIVTFDRLAFPPFHAKNAIKTWFRQDLI